MCYRFEHSVTSSKVNEWATHQHARPGLWRRADTKLAAGARANYVTLRGCERDKRTATNSPNSSGQERPARRRVALGFMNAPHLFAARDSCSPRCRNVLRSVRAYATTKLLFATMSLNNSPIAPCSSARSTKSLPTPSALTASLVLPPLSASCRKLLMVDVP